MAEKGKLNIVNDDKACAEVAEDIFSKLQKIDPKRVHCMINMVVLCPEEGDSDQHSVEVRILGTDEDVAKMLVHLVNIARNSVVQAALPPDDSTTKH